jgi:hypothetical protein
MARCSCVNDGPYSEMCLPCLVASGEATEEEIARFNCVDQEPDYDNDYVPGEGDGEVVW